MHIDDRAARKMEAQSVNYAKRLVRAPEVQMRGDLLSECHVEVRQLPRQLCNPRVATVGSSAVQISFELARGLSKGRFNERMHIAIVGADGDVRQTVAIPVIGFVRE